MGTNINRNGSHWSVFPCYPSPSPICCVLRSVRSRTHTTTTRWRRREENKGEANQWHTVCSFTPPHCVPLFTSLIICTAVRLACSAPSRTSSHGSFPISSHSIHVVCLCERANTTTQWMNGREGTVRTLEVRLVRSVQFPPSLIVSANFAVKPLGGSQSSREPVWIDFSLRLDWPLTGPTLSRLVTQDIKTQPQINRVKAVWDRKVESHGEWFQDYKPNEWTNICYLKFVRVPCHIPV